MSSSIHINLKREIDNSYNIEIGLPIDKVGRTICKLFPHSKKFIVTDSNVGKLYGKRLLRSFSKDEQVAHVVTVPSGEKSKNRKRKEQIENTMLMSGADRDSLIIALGGGTIGDLAGFVAATYMRGIPYIHIPTTLLAQVDSSIGGKVAIDHPAGKNLLGTFHQPSGVYTDPAVLLTLSDREFKNGLAEVIKYAAILDASLFRYLEMQRGAIGQRQPAALRKIIKRCCELKRDIVQKDEKEAGLRRILNFGHTIGHAIELLSNYRVPHGRAVALGMIIEARMSMGIGLLSERAFRRLTSLVSMYYLPTSLPGSMNIQSVIRATRHDKKSRNGTIAYTLLEKIGKARMGILLSPERALKIYNQ